MLPNTIVLGSAKCATSSLHHYLGQHPEVHMSRKKECHYFCHEEIDGSLYKPRHRPICNLQDYEAQFEDGKDAKCRGESSPMYLFYESSAKNISELVSDAKLIAVLRNPVDRAFSAYVHAVRDELETLSFEDAILAEKERTASGKFTPLQAYVEFGQYCQKLRPFFEHFDKDQLLVLSYDEIKRDIKLTLRKICMFMGIDQDFEFDVRPRLNRSGVPHRRWIQRMVMRASRDEFPFQFVKKPFTNSAWIRVVKGIEFWNYEKLVITNEQRAFAQEFFEDDARKLSTEMGINFHKDWF